MKKIKQAALIVIYLFSIWHAYSMVALPLSFHGIKLPLSHFVNSYATFFLTNRAWAYFYKRSPINVNLEYSIHSNIEEKKIFFSPSEDYIRQRRFFRCAGCSESTFQLHSGEIDDKKNWLIGYYLCPFYKSDEVITLYVKEAPYNLKEYKIVKTEVISCENYK